MSLLNMKTNSQLANLKKEAYCKTANTRMQEIFANVADIVR